MKQYVAVGLSVLAGAALLEAALIPGLVIGGAAVLAPMYLPKGLLPRRLLPKRLLPKRLLPKLPRRRPLAAATVERQVGQEVAPWERLDLDAPRTAPALGIKQAIAKTITFRIIVTTLDFSTNYLVLGEFATAAGLSAFALVVGPLFYLSHETAWNYFGPAAGAEGRPVLVLFKGRGKAPLLGRRGLPISRALAKTVTFRTIATVMDFTATYVVVGDLATAAGLSAFGFVAGPFVYLGHEMAWDYYNSPKRRIPEPPEMKLLASA